MNSKQFNAIRAFKDMSQVEFADWLGTSLATVAKIEAEHMKLSDKMKWRLTHKFDVSDSNFIEFCKKRQQIDEYFNDN